MAPRASSKTAKKKTAKAKKTVASKKAKKVTAKAKTKTKASVSSKKAATKKAPARKMTAIKQAYKQKEIKQEIAEHTGLNHKDVGNVMEELFILIKRHICKNGVGEFTLPGLMKIVTVKKPARKARKGRNPFTGEEIMLKAKPASMAVKIKALKKLKESVK